MKPATFAAIYLAISLLGLVWCMGLVIFYRGRTDRPVPRRILLWAAATVALALIAFGALTP